MVVGVSPVRVGRRQAIITVKAAHDELPFVLNKTKQTPKYGNAHILIVNFKKIQIVYTINSLREGYSYGGGQNE